MFKDHKIIVNGKTQLEFERQMFMDVVNFHSTLFKNKLWKLFSLKVYYDISGVIVGVDWYSENWKIKNGYLEWGPCNANHDWKKKSWIFNLR